MTEGRGPALGARVARGQVLGDSCNRARGLTNEPGNVLTPAVFATRVAAVAAEGAIRCEILDGPQIEALGMGLLLGVARGSVEPPRVAVLRYDPPGVTSGPMLGLVGKGVTFDTGGFSIKPAEGMERMKDDMAGGASVVAAMRAIALQKLPVRAVVVVPMTENMPSGTAVKPGDVITSHLGKVDIVVSSTASRAPIVTRTMIDVTMKQRGYEPMFIVDLAVPRDVEPAVGERVVVAWLDKSGRLSPTSAPITA